nr:hypothetical protein [Tanacetum cinerariifolium]
AVFCSTDVERSKQVGQNFVQSSIEPHLHDIHVDRDTHEVDRLEVPKELPKVSMVNSCLKKLKFHLASFDMVVKERTIATAITKGTWGFEHTKACFRNDIIPFVKNLKELFTSFDQCLIDEVTEVQHTFKQMELAVEQHCAEKTKFQTKMESVLQENDRLLTQALSVEIMNIVVHANVKFDCLNVDACVHCVPTESELKPNFIKKECYETFQNPQYLKKAQQLKPNLYDGSVIGKSNVVVVPDSEDNLMHAEESRSKMIEKQNAPQMIEKKVITKPIDYAALNRLSIDFNTRASGSKSQDNTMKNKIWQTQKKAKETELEEHLRTVKSSLNKASVVDSKATSSVIKSVSNVNSNLKCASCNGCLFSNNHDACVVAYINSMNARKKSKSVKTPVKRKVWKSTGKVFKTVGYIWKPTGRTFTLVGNVCPLTRIATATIVPPREPIPIVKSTDKPVVTLVYTRKPKAKNVPNKMEPNKS